MLRFLQRLPGRRAWWQHVLLAVCLAALVATLVWSKAPFVEGFTDVADDAATIFVSIASYRDVDCHATLSDVFKHASKPERVFVGVCEQNTKANAEACLPPEFQWHDQIRRISVPHKEAKGPTFARYLCSTLYRGETFFCQVDSHTRFTPGWDSRAIAMLKTCPSPKPVLTHYPHDWGEAQKEGGAVGVPVLCKAEFGDNGVLTFNAVTLPASAAPRPVPFTSGGFVFGPGTMVTEVPYDPDLPHLFQGEEVLMSARLWTTGYDFFTPVENLVFHNYTRAEAPKFWNDVDYTAEQKNTVEKVKALLTGGMGAYKHGMGASRTLQQYWEYAGVDWATKTTTSGERFCK